jgi:DNA invertase Pin-like site-specific DNA recombinase
MNNLLKNVISNELHVNSITILGQNNLEILKSIEFFTSKGICIISEKEKIRTLNEQGILTPLCYLLITTLKSLSEHQLEIRKQKQQEGISKAKNCGSFLGRKIGSVEDTTKFLKKYSEVVEALKSGRSINSIANDKRFNVSAPTVIKIRKALAL